MRINVYAEELTDRVECITKTAEGRKFYGLRIYLASVPELLPKDRGGTHGDDDQSAVTLWFASHQERYNFCCGLADTSRRGIER